MSLPQHWWSASQSYVSEILSLLAAAPDRDVVHWRCEAFSGGDLIRSVTETFLALRNRGVGKGDVVAILVAPNSPEMLTVRYATHLLGGAVCYVRTTNPGTRATVLPLDHQIQILRDTETVTVYADAENSERATELADGSGIPVTRRQHGERNEVGRVDVADTPDAVSWEPDALAFIGFTSGSTGRPKGIRLGGRAWEATMRAWMEVGREYDCASILVSTPLSHGVAAMADAVFALGGALYLHETFDAEKFVDTVSAEKGVSWTFMATNHVFQVLDHLLERGIRDRDALEAAGLSSLKRIVYGGSPAAPARIAQAFRIFGPALAQGYATSESGRITILTPQEHGDPELAATVGRPFPEVEVVVCNSNSGAQLAAGEIGEVRVRSPQMMDGYNGNPELTVQVLRDGWYFTGDIGCLDERGYLTLLGRVAHVIKVGGVKVHPIVLEAEILSHPGVRHAAVYGVRDEDGSDHIHAAIECDPAEVVEVEDIRARIAEALSPIHVPEKIHVLSALPMNSNGKPDKVLLKSQCS
ncbi:fatty acid--CoA ligase [Streptomyces lunaelactis]|uniref:Fatty acid--CoA ligase n=1 Tax=Streptomyces lunaelactis TaxID=1535768 RepID=A0A2R4TAA3_9ACTN|nr:fatty acid--CoA ligase family protein [Streptomyces lunaelactis]AVZ76079.1 fatty acid--CoA ligase [Streptomyces lunaelactis]NUK87591.1 long-chain fatty acid--CoA ligase [Streptomyces lunaelactis]